MSFEKYIDDLKKHLDYARDYCDNVTNEFVSKEGEYLNIIATLNDETDTLREQNELLEEQVEDLNRKLAIFELENVELRLRVEVYAMDL